MDSAIEKRYDRLASIYDLWDVIPERLLYRSWRLKLWEKVQGERILEVGVGTGKNIPFYPSGAQTTAIDISPRMLEKARARANQRHDVTVELLKADLNDLTFEDNSFDAVVGSFILMVLPDPLKALKEIKRVCQPHGKIFFLEFTRSDSKIAAFFQDLLTPLTRAVYHAYLNRDIVGLIQRSGFRVTEGVRMSNGIVELIEANIFPVKP